MISHRYHSQDFFGATRLSRFDHITRAIGFMMRMLFALMTVVVSFTACAQSILPKEEQSARWFKAAQFDDIKYVTQAAQQDFDVNVGEATRGETALMLSVRQGSSRVLGFLATHPKSNINQRAKNGDTAIMLAAYLSNVDYVKLLIDAGAQLNQTGWTALHYAATVGDAAIITLLLQSGAEVDSLSPNNTTPLMMAARKGDVATVDILVKAGADLRKKNMLGMTALDFATDASMRQVSEYLTALQDKSTPSD